MDKKCEQCGKHFQAKRRDARFCGGKCRINSVRGKPKFDVNADAREALKKRVPVARPAPVVTNPAPAAVFGLLKSKLARKDTRGPIQKKVQQKGGEA